MRRPNLFTLAAAVSAVLCATVCVLWVRSYRMAAGEEDRLTWRSPGRQVRDRVEAGRADGWHTVRSEGGRITLFGPPAPVGTPQVRLAAADLAAGLKNEQLEWHSVIAKDGDRVYIDATKGWVVPTPPASPPPGWSPSPAWALWDHPVWRRDKLAKFTAAEVARPLLSALDDPGRFAVAHLVLTGFYPSGPWRPGERPFTRVPGTTGNGADRGPFLTNCNGLFVDLSAPSLEPGMAAWLDSVPVKRTYTQVVARADPAQIPVLREQWRRRLEVPVGSVRYSSLAAATAFPPLLWCGVRVRRAWVRTRRRRLGLCVNCGFDLRMTPERCPECGTPGTVGRPKGTGSVDADAV